MSGNFWLDWAIFAASLFNTILLLWLGLTVLLNAEQRSWGLWLAGGGLLVGCGFFVSHTAILNHSLTVVTQSTDIWWRLGWFTLVGLPFAWYVLMLWYTGFWSERHRRRRARLLVAALGTSLLLAMFLAIQALPDYREIVQSGVPIPMQSQAVPWPIVIYPVYSLFCIALSLRALAHPTPSPRVFGDLARQRARPWLVGASVALLLVSLMVSAAVGWAALGRFDPGPRSRAGFRELDVARTIGQLDLAVSVLIAGAVVLLGQAIVAYEIFTGQNLPRRGFRRHWRRAVILAAGYSVVVGWSLAVQLRAIYGLLLTALVMTTFYAMLVWRTFEERQRVIAQLRPFLSSSQLHDRLMGVGTSTTIDVDGAFGALCADVLGARSAALIPAGTSTALISEPLVYPAGRDPAVVRLQALVEKLCAPDLEMGSVIFCHSVAGTPPRPVYVGIDPVDFGGAEWAVALWQEDGLDGLLLLGPKADGGLYTQEEMELAQAAGERLVDLQASAEMGRRLVALQRKHLAEAQVGDQRVRRVLHDDVLPDLHAAILSLTAEAGCSAFPSGGEAVSQLAAVHRRVADLLREMPVAGVPEVARLGIVGALRRVIEGELRGSFDTVSWELAPEAEGRLQRLPSLTAEVVFFAAREALRNAARYGRGDIGAQGITSEQTLSLAVALSDRDGLVLQIEDDGIGISPVRISECGSGQGLALHSTMMAIIGGSLEIQSSPGEGTRVTLMIPEVEDWPGKITMSR